MKKFPLLPSLGVSAFFFACGGDTTENITNNYTSGMEIADKLSDLPKCTADNAGEQYMVKSDADVYVCTGKDWKKLGGETSTDTVYVSGENITCTTKPLADSSGVNILCNDKVIGSILNGSKGEQGDDGKDGAGCSVIYQTEESVTIKCGDDKFNMNLNGGGEVITPADDIMFLEELQGVAQKGPFAAGSSVLVYELKGDKNLTKTNRFFDGMITSDDGKYSISNISLASPYALLEANGYYLNEVSANTAYTTSPIKLYAYTDLNDRKKANINVLTHLEFFRVRELMANSDGTLKLTDAKKQAQKEIFAAFGIDAKNFDASEDLNILGTSDQSAALLAVSVLVKLYVGDSKLTARLTQIGQDIAKDGKWNDAALRASIADLADSADLGEDRYSVNTTLPKIRSNASDWGNVPDFEKYVRNFWYNEYGLGACDESNKNVVARDTNSKSALYASKYAYAGSNDKKVRFICDEKSKLWRRATDIEKDTAGWGNNFKNGDVRNGQVNTNLVYVYEDGKWRHGTAIDSLMYEQRANGGKACTKSALNDTSTVKVNNLYYVCSAGTQDTAYRWTNTAGNFYNDTYEARTKCSTKTDGDLINGRVNTSKVYACNGTTGWKEITDGLSKTLGGCYTNLIDSVGLYSGTYYVCLSNGWVWASEARINTIHYECKKNGELLKGLVNTDKYYTCDADTFRVERDSISINYFEKACVSYLESVTAKNGTKWLCQNSKWVWDENAIAGTMTDDRDGKEYKIAAIKTQTWMAENLNYDYNEGTAKSYCYSNSSTNCDKYGRLYLWSAAMDSAGVFTTTGKGCGYGKTCSPSGTIRGVCPEGWHLPSNDDWNVLWTAIGGTSTAGTKLKSTSGWNSNGNGEDAYGFSVLPAGNRNNDGSFYDQGNDARFWSSSESSSVNAWHWFFHYYYGNVSQYYYYNKDNGYSVRCLKD